MRHEVTLAVVMGSDLIIEFPLPTFQDFIHNFNVSLTSLPLLFLLSSLIPVPPITLSTNRSSPSIHIAIMKKLLGDYLAGNGYTAAADAYRQLVVEYRDCEGLSLDAKKQSRIDVIGPGETQARTLY